MRHLGSQFDLVPPEPSPFAAPPESPQVKRWVWGCAFFLLVMSAIPLGLTFTIPFLGPDVTGVGENYGIRRLWPIRSAVLASQGEGRCLRPLAGYSLALNYALSGPSVRGYHVFNALLHLGSVLLLFGLVRRSLMPAEITASVPRSAFLIALVTGALWAIHPLQTEIVSYISNRAELLLGFFVLLALYSFLRSQASIWPRMWLAVSAGAGVLAMLSSPVAIGLPVVIWFYDRAFVSKSWRLALRTRKIYYLALAASGLIPIFLWFCTPAPAVIGSRAPIATLLWPAVEAQLWLNYLRQSLWPWPLVILREAADLAARPDLWLAVIGVLLLILIVIYAAVRQPAWGFLGFVILYFSGPMFCPAAQPRELNLLQYLYLPLAGVLVAVILLINFAVTRLSDRFARFRIWPARAALAISLLVMVAWIVAGVHRLDVHQTPQRYWEYVLTGVPHCAAAQDALGQVCKNKNDYGRAFEWFNQALANDPQYSPARVDLADLLDQLYQTKEALLQYEKTITDAPAYPPAYVHLGILLSRSGRFDEAIVRFKQALSLDPNLAGAYSNLGSTLSLLDRHEEAIAAHRQAIALEATNPEFYFRLGLALARQERWTEAETVFEEVLRLAPGHTRAQGQLRNVQQLLKKSNP